MLYITEFTVFGTLGDCSQVYKVLYTSVDERQQPFEGAVRAPTVVSSHRQGQPRLLVPFYDGHTYI